MGKYSEKYAEQLKNKLPYEKEPNRDENVQGYVEWQREKRRQDRVKDHYRETLFSVRPSTENVMESYFQVNKGTYEEEYKKWMEAIKKFPEEKSGEQSEFGEALARYVKNFRKDLAESSKEVKIVFDIDTPGSIDLCRQYLKEGKISEQELKDAVTYHFLLLGMNPTTTRVSFVEKLEVNFNDEQKKQLDEKLDKYVDIMDRPEEEQILHPFRDSKEYQDLKDEKKIPEELKKDPEKLKKYIKALDYAAENLVLPEQSFQTELAERETTDINRAEVGISNKLKNDNKETFRNGRYNNLFTSKKLMNNEVYIVPPERAKDYKELREDHLQISDKTKDGIKRILQKMEEYHFLDYKHDKMGEEGSKEYAFHKLVEKRRDLEKALESKDPDKIIEAAEAYEQATNEMKELFAIAKECFNQDPIHHPGNMDSIRTDYIPVTFTKDTATTAQVNVLFGLCFSLKQQNITIDQYLEESASKLTSEALKNAEKGSFIDVSKNLSFEDAVDLMFDSGKFAKAGGLYFANSATVAASRSLGGTTSLEADQKLLGGNLILADLYRDMVEHSMQTETSKFSYFKNTRLSEKDRIDRNQTLENVILANDKDRNLNAMLVGIPETDIAGGVIGPEFNAEEYVRKNYIEIKDVRKRASIMLDKIQNSPRIAQYVKPDDVLEAVSTAYYKVLIQRSVSWNTEDYKQFLEEFESLPNRLSKDASPEMRQRMEGLVEKHRKELGNLEPSGSLSLLDSQLQEADKGVINGSNEYKDAWDALKEVRELYNQMLEIQNNGGALKEYDGRQESIDKLRAKMEEADALIEKYFERKTGQREMGENKKAPDKLDAKSQKRIKMMQNARLSLKGISKSVDDKQLTLDTDRMQYTKGSLINVDIHSISENEQKYKEAAEKFNDAKAQGMDRYSANAALAAFQKLNQMKSGTLTDKIPEKDMPIVHKCMAQLILDEMMKDPVQGAKLRTKSPKNLDSYNKELDSLVKSEAFKNVAPKKMVKSELREFLVEPKHVKELLDKFNTERIRIETRDLKAQQKKELNALQNKAVNSGAQRDRANAVTGKNPAVHTRPRSNTVNGKPQPKAQGDQPEGPNAGRAMNGPKGF